MYRAASLLAAIIFAVAANSSLAEANSVHSGGMKMAIPEGPAHFAPTREAYTTNHLFLVKLTALPQPIPFEKYFTLRFAIYDGHHPTKHLADATLQVFAGMRHRLKHGFAHGMESAPEMAKKGGVITVSGMYFHMMGPWVLKTTVHDGGKAGVAYFRLPCCGT